MLPQRWRLFMEGDQTLHDLWGRCVWFWGLHGLYWKMTSMVLNICADQTDDVNLLSSSSFEEQ